MSKEQRQIPVSKNEKVVITIDDIGTEGQGIGKVDGYTLFVEGLLPREKAEVMVVKTGKRFGYGKVVRLIEASDERVEPLCPSASRCGGCSLQHLSYKGQLLYKQNKVEQLMRRMGKLDTIKVLPTIGMEEPWHYRNKVQFPVRQSKDGTKIGYYAKRSHRIIESETCYIQDKRNENIREILLEWMENNNIDAYDEEKHKGVVRHIVTRHSFSTGLMHVMLVINANKVKAVDSLIEKLSLCGYVSGIGLNINKEKTNVIMGRKLIHLWGQSYVEDKIGEVTFHISPLSFYQVNPVQTKVLYDKVLEMANLTGEETVLDLYCGIGTISLFLAQKAKKVIGVEIVDAAVEDARHNAKINGIDNVQFYTGKAEEVIPRLYKEEQINADVIVVDPPRKGCDDVLLETIVAINPKRVVYVSCDPATLARDIAYLTQHEFEVHEVQPVDMFPQTTHVECVVGIQRVKSTK